MRLRTARATWSDERRWNIELELTTMPATNLGVWHDGQWHPDFSVSGRQLSFHVPAAAAAGTTASVGFEEPAGSGQYVVFGHFGLVRTAEGRPALQALNPGD